MNKHISGSYIKRQNYQLIRPSGSLILHSPSNAYQQGLPPKIVQNYNLDNMENNKFLLSRYSSSEELKRVNQQNCKYQLHQMTVWSKVKKNYEQTQNTKGEKNINREKFTKLKLERPKDSGKQFDHYKHMNELNHSNKKLKETTSTSTTEPFSACKSQKMIPSFLRNHTRSAERKKPKERNTLSKQNFKIIKSLGEGKFGVVNLAKQIQTGMLVALKIVNKQKIINQNLLVQFIRELKIQMFLDHQNIIKTFGFFTDQEHFYTILQLGSDGQLYDIISSGQTISEESTSFIIGNLLDAVCYMHKHKILHRDIKPENIVLVHGNVKLCDFGWAVNKKEELRSTFCGTPLYLSPELLLGEKYDEKIDLWAIGILAYELNLGQSPFEINQHDDLVKIITEDIRFPTNRKISKEFRNFIRAILKKDPKERISAQELLNLDFVRKYKELQTCEELCQ